MHPANDTETRVYNFRVIVKDFMKSTAYDCSVNVTPAPLPEPEPVPIPEPEPEPTPEPIEEEEPVVVRMEDSFKFLLGEHE